MRNLKVNIHNIYIKLKVYRLAYISYIISIYSFLVTIVFALNVHVTTFNETLKKYMGADKIFLVQLKDTMKIIQTIDQPTSKYSFNNLEMDASAPYMIQVDYKGVKYNKVIPPINQKNDINIDIQMYEPINHYKTISSKLKSNIIYTVELKNNSLEFLVLYHFKNTSSYTLMDKKKGIQIFIPKEANNIQASVQIGNKKSNIQWLKKNPQKISTETYVINYPLKPGDKVYQFSYSIPYKGSKKIPFKNYYAPLTQSVEMFVNVEDMQIISKNFNQVVNQVNKINGNLYQLNPANITNWNILFKGGISTTNKVSDDTIYLTAHFTYTTKFIVIIFCVILFFIIIWLIQYNPSFIKKYRMQEYAKAKVQLNIAEKPYQAELQNQVNFLKKKLNITGTPD